MIREERSPESASGGVTVAVSSSEKELTWVEDSEICFAVDFICDLPRKG